VTFVTDIVFVCVFSKYGYAFSILMIDRSLFFSGNIVMQRKYVENSTTNNSVSFQNFLAKFYRIIAKLFNIICCKLYSNWLRCSYFIMKRLGQFPEYRSDIITVWRTDGRTDGIIVAKAVVTTAIRLSFDCDSTARRPFDNLRYERTPNCVRVLLRCSPNE